MKNKKLIIIISVIICIPLLLGCAKPPKYYGEYVCTIDADRSVELLEFSIPKRKGKASFKNVLLPTLGLETYSTKNINFEVIKKSGKMLTFVCIVSGETVSGTLDLESITVVLDGHTYIKT